MLFLYCPEVEISEQKMHGIDVKSLPVMNPSTAQLIDFVRTLEAAYTPVPRALALHSPLSQVRGPWEEETKL